MGKRGTINRDEHSGVSGNSGPTIGPTRAATKIARVHISGTIGEVAIPSDYY